MIVAFLDYSRRSVDGKDLMRFQNEKDVFKCRVDGAYDISYKQRVTLCLF